MRQTLGEFDEHDEGFGLMGEERADDYPPPERRLPRLVLGVLAMAVFAGGLWFAYVQGGRHAATTAQSGGVPLIRAEQGPSKVKPDQPGGMTIPDQNVSLYNEKPGGPPVEKLLPAAEQPMPRPAPPPPPPAVAAPAPAAAPPSPPAPAAAANPPLAPAPETPPAAAAGNPLTIAPPPAAAPAVPKPEAKAAAHAAALAEARSLLGQPPLRSGPVQIRLGSVRSPEAARDEWARLKRDYPELLGRLSGVAVRTDLGDKGIYYRIEAGPLADAGAAARLCGELKRHKLGCILAR